MADKNEHKNKNIKLDTYEKLRETTDSNVCNGDNQEIHDNSVSISNNHKKFGLFFFRNKKKIMKLCLVIFITLIIGIIIFWGSRIVCNKIAENIYNEFRTDSITYDEAIHKIDLIDIFGNITVYRNNCNNLKNSRDAYLKAMEYKNQNNNLEAIREFKKVVSDDSNYEIAQQELQSYTRIYREKYKKYIEEKDYSSALILCLSGYGNISSEEKYKLVDSKNPLYSIYPFYTTDFYWSTTPAGQQILFPRTMNADKYFRLTEASGGMLNSILKGWEFGEEHILIPNCIKYGDDDAFIFSLYIDDDNIEKIYKKDDKGDYTIPVYDKETDGAIMYDKSIHNTYTTEGIANMIYDFVLDKKPMSFKTNNGDIITISENDSKVWVDAFAYNYVCNQNKDAFYNVYKSVYNNPLID